MTQNASLHQDKQEIKTVLDNIDNKDNKESSDVTIVNKQDTCQKIVQTQNKKDNTDNQDNKDNQDNQDNQEKTKNQIVTLMTSIEEDKMLIAKNTYVLFILFILKRIFSEVEFEINSYFLSLKIFNNL